MTQTLSWPRGWILYSVRQGTICPRLCWQCRACHPILVCQGSYITDSSCLEGKRLAYLDGSFGEGFVLIQERLNVFLLRDLEKGDSFDGCHFVCFVFEIKMQKDQRWMQVQVVALLPWGVSGEAELRSKCMRGTAISAASMAVHRSLRTISLPAIETVHTL